LARKQQHDEAGEALRRVAQRVAVDRGKTRHLSRERACKSPDTRCGRKRECVAGAAYVSLAAIHFSAMPSKKLQLHC
jgi:ferric-dicitrate binding protein FerR (iron transport regulator)